MAEAETQKKGFILICKTLMKSKKKSTIFIIHRLYIYKNEYLPEFHLTTKGFVARSFHNLK